MKKLIFILLSVMSFAITVAQATTASGCINNAGHISLTVDSANLDGILTRPLYIEIRVYP